MCSGSGSGSGALQPFTWFSEVNKMLDKSRIFTFQSCNEKRLKNWLRDWMVYWNLTSKISLYNSKRTWFSFHFCKMLHEILYLSLSIEPTNAPLSKMALKTLKIYIYWGLFWHYNLDKKGFAWTYSYIEWIMIPLTVFLHKPGKRLADLYSLLLPSECWNTKTESVKAHAQWDYSPTRISNCTRHQMDYAATS